MNRTECDIVEIEPRILAVARCRVSVNEIAERIPALFSTVYDWLGKQDLNPVGRNHALYQSTGDGLLMQAGVPVNSPFAPTHDIVRVQIPGSRAARLTHYGDYENLYSSHARLSVWCAAQGYSLSGLSWEEYGVWSDNSAKLCTQVYLRMQN